MQSRKTKPNGKTPLLYLTFNNYSNNDHSTRLYFQIKYSNEIPHLYCTFYTILKLENPFTLSSMYLTFLVTSKLNIYVSDPSIQIAITIPQTKNTLQICIHSMLCVCVAYVYMSIYSYC